MQNIERIECYTRGLTKRTFRKNGLVLDLVEHCLMRIGEAARKLEGQRRSSPPFALTRASAIDSVTNMISGRRYHHLRRREEGSCPAQDSLP